MQSSPSHRPPAQGFPSAVGYRRHRRLLWRGLRLRARLCVRPPDEMDTEHASPRQWQSVASRLKSSRWLLEGQLAFSIGLPRLSSCALLLGMELACSSV